MQEIVNFEPVCKPRRNKRPTSNFWNISLIPIRMNQIMKVSTEREAISKLMGS